MELTRKAHLPRKALLVIADGMDNHSRYSKSELIAAAMESDLQIYSISIFDPPRNKKPIELAEERNGVLFLEELTRRTGGVQIVVRDASDIDRAAADIGHAMRDQYLIGYIPQSTDRDGKWHSVKVKLSVAGAKAYARSGFYGN
jgi:Ca-activated chloride channel homolog